MKESTLIFGGLLSLNILGSITYDEKENDVRKNTTDDVHVNHSLETALQEPMHIAEAIACHQHTSPVNYLIPTQIHEENLKESIGHIKHNPALIVYFICTVFMNGGHTILRIFIYNHIVAVYESHFWAGTALTLLGVGFLSMSVVMSVINFKFRTNKYPIHLAGLLLMGCFAMAIAVINNVYGIAALVGLYGIAFSVMITNNACMVTHLIGTQSHGLVYALSRTCEGLGGLVFPPISVAIHTNLLSHSMFSFAASLMFFAFILMLIVLLTKRNIWTPFSERVE